MCVGGAVQQIVAAEQFGLPYKVGVYFVDQRIAIFEAESDRLPIPPFAESFSLTVGQMFSWLAE